MVSIIYPNVDQRCYLLSSLSFCSGFLSFLVSFCFYSKSVMVWVSVPNGNLFPPSLRPAVCGLWCRQLQHVNQRGQVRPLDQLPAGHVHLFQRVSVQRPPLYNGSSGIFHQQHQPEHTNQMERLLPSELRAKGWDIQK